MRRSTIKRRQIADYTAALAINPGLRLRVRLAMRVVPSISTRVQRALADCDKAIELEPRLAYAYRVRAVAFLSGKDLNAAARRRQSSDQAGPRKFPAFVSPYAGRISCSASIYGAPSTTARTAASINPDNDVAFFYRGRAEIEREQWSAAVADFVTALELDSADTNAYYWLALAKLRSSMQYADGADGYRPATSKQISTILTAISSARKSRSSWEICGGARLSDDRVEALSHHER